MPADNKDTKKINGAGNPNAGSSNNTANGNNGHQNNQSSAADEPYFAQTRMQDRSEHVSRLSNQIDKTDEILKK